MWPRKKPWWEIGPGGTPPLQNPRNTVLTDKDDPMWRVRRDIQHPDVRILPKAQSNPIKIYPNTGPPGLMPRRMPTAPYQGMEPTATLNSAAMPKKKGFFGKMSPEELKDFQEVLKEMRLDIKPEFVAGGREGRTEQYSFLPFDQTPEQKKKREERQSLFSFLA